MPSTPSLDPLVTLIAWRVVRSAAAWFRRATLVVWRIIRSAADFGNRFGGAKRLAFPRIGEWTRRYNRTDDWRNFMASLPTKMFDDRNCGEIIIVNDPQPLSTVVKPNPRAGHPTVSSTNIYITPRKIRQTANNIDIGAASHFCHDGISCSGACAQICNAGCGDCLKMCIGHTCQHRSYNQGGGGNGLK